MDSRAFYDDYVGRQTAAGVNARHHAIVGWLGRFGMRPDHRVLEIGCGVGTVTGLISAALGPEGSLLGVDLSPRSIDVAREHLAGRPHVRLEAGDALSMEIAGRFDVIVLPDVIEHIPLEHHPALFTRVASWLAPDGFVLLHYPNPWYLSWCRENRPDLLQLIDQPIHADVLAANVYPAGLWIAFLETYSIWIEEGDYVAAVLRRSPEGGTFTPIEPRPPSLLARAAGRLRRAFG